MIRESRCSIEESAFHIAMLWAELRSKGNTKVGAAVIHRKSHGIFLGYNGFPSGVIDDETLWKSQEKHDFVIHAEVNAMRKATAALGTPLDDCTLVCTMYPCLACLREIKANKINEVLYLEYNAGILLNENKEARNILTKSMHIARIIPSVQLTLRDL
jgi:dCMP deaminase